MTPFDVDVLAEAVQRARALRRDGQAAEAVAVLAATVDDDAPWMLQHELAQALASDGRPEDAVALFERAARNGGDGVAGLWVNLGNARRSCARKLAALDAYRRALALDDGLAAAWFNQHAALYDAGHPEAAIRSLERAVALRPDHLPSAFHLRALTALHGGASAELDEAPDFMKSSLAFVRARPEAARFADTFDTLGFGLEAAPDEGLVVELGVRRGTTLRFLAEAVTPAPVVGFDSFEGLPEAWGPQPRGLYDAGGERPPVPDNAQVVAGWFADTLPGFVAARPGLRLRLMHVDCDLYASTREALTALAGAVVQGTVLVFDEYLMNPGWDAEEHRALVEVAAREGWRCEYLAFSLFTRQAVVRLHLA